MSLHDVINRNTVSGVHKWWYNILIILVFNIHFVLKKNSPWTSWTPLILVSSIVEVLGTNRGVTVISRIHSHFVSTKNPNPGSTALWWDATVAAVYMLTPLPYCLARIQLSWVSCTCCWKLDKCAQLNTWQVSSWCILRHRWVRVGLHKSVLIDIHSKQTLDGILSQCYFSFVDLYVAWS